MTGDRPPLPLVVRLRFRGAWVVSVVVLGIGGLFVGTMAYLLVAATAVLPDFLDLYARQESLSLGEDFSYAMSQVVLFLVPFFYIGFYLLPFVLTLPVTAPIIALWHTPARFLFLRPFNHGPLTRSLTRVARRDVAPFGHVYTLSDSDIKVPWYIRVPLVLGQLALFSFRIRRVRDARHVEGLGRAADRIWLRNINWCMSFSKVFPVASTDERWREVVGCLLKRSDGILVDASELRENLLWEVEHARALGLEPRMLYLIPADRIEAARPALIQALGDEACVSRLFAYEKHGVVERDRFVARLAKLSGMAPEDGDHRRAQRPDRMDITATVAFAVGLIPLLALAFNGPLGLPRWSPWEHPAYWPGLAHIINPGALTVATLGMATWFLLAITARRSHNIRFLLAIQTLLLLAAPIGMLDW